MDPGRPDHAQQCLADHLDTEATELPGSTREPAVLFGRQQDFAYQQEVDGNPAQLDADTDVERDHIIKTVEVAVPAARLLERPDFDPEMKRPIATVIGAALVLFRAIAGFVVLAGPRAAGTACSASRHPHPAGLSSRSVDAYAPPQRKAS